MQISCALCGASVQTEQYTVLCPACVERNRERVKFLDVFLDVFSTVKTALTTAQTFTKNYPDHALLVRTLIADLKAAMPNLGLKAAYLREQDREIDQRVDAARQRARLGA